jgi:GNAT superfamily N-acetyltransferase
MRLRRWMNEWAQHDLSERHWHLGPAAVDSAVQGQGIGSAVMPYVCDWLDQREATAYLETEQPKNVRLYRRFGFLVIEEGTVLDVPCWFMMRRPHTVPSTEAAQ